MWWQRIEKKQNFAKSVANNRRRVLKWMLGCLAVSALCIFMVWHIHTTQPRRGILGEETSGIFIAMGAFVTACTAFMAGYFYSVYRFSYQFPSLAEPDLPLDLDGYIRQRNEEDGVG